MKETVKKPHKAKLEPVYRSQAPGYYHKVVTPDLPSGKASGRDGKTVRATETGVSRNTNSLEMVDKHVKDYPAVGPAEFRSRTVDRMHGFRQAKPVVSETSKAHRVSKDPTPRQDVEPFWQRFKPATEDP